MRIAYRIETTPDDNGTLLVTYPAFPEVTTFSRNNLDQLLSIARAAIEEAIAARISDGQALPPTDTQAEKPRPKGVYVTAPSCRQRAPRHQS